MSVKAVFAVPGDIEARTGGYGYDRRVLALLPQAGVPTRLLRLPGSFPAPTAAHLAETAAALAAVSADHVLLIDGLAMGVLPAALLEHVRAPVVALVHHPLGLETGLSQADSARLIAQETQALKHARACVVTSAMTARLVVEHLSYPAHKIVVAEPGTDAAARARGSGGYPAALFAAGSIIPRKGYDVLMAALARLKDIDWRITIAGNRERDPATAQALDQQIAALGLASRITMRGDLTQTELNAAYDRTDIFVMASHYEGYGMVLAEALARGLPIVTTRGGAAAETVPAAAGLKTPPGDAPALATALRRMITNAKLRTACAEEAWQAGQSLPRWEDAARIIAGALRAAHRS